MRTGKHVIPFLLCVTILYYMGYVSYEPNDDTALSSNTICERKKFILIWKIQCSGIRTTSRFKSHLSVQSHVKFFGYVANTVCMPVHIHCFFSSLCYLSYTTQFSDMKLCITVNGYEYFGRTYCLHLLLRKQGSTAIRNTSKFSPHTLWCHILENCILDRYSDIFKSHLVSVPVAEFSWIQQGKETKSVKPCCTKFGWRTIFMPYFVLRQGRPCYRSQIIVSVKSAISGICLSRAIS